MHKSETTSDKDQINYATAINPIWICAKATNYVTFSAICQEIEDIKKSKPAEFERGWTF
jgi:hypothetical protein